MKVYFYIWLILSLQTHSLYAQKADSKEIQTENAEDTESEDDYVIPEPTAAEKKAVCKKYEKSYIVYYGTVYHVNSCTRELLSSDQVYKLTKSGKIKLKEVDAAVIASLPGGANYREVGMDPKTLCKRLEGQYITFSFVDVYWVESCKKRPFPDWSSYESHRGKLKNAKVPLKSLELDDFLALENGDPMPSVIDEEFRELLRPDNVDIIPLDEACHGVVGTYVTYLGQIYFIEAMKQNGAGKLCQKRRVDAEEYTRKKANSKFHLKELSSSQAISIPEGDPMYEKSKRSKKG
ncbi:MAG: hypothetical protein HRU09_12350 [Oligoflexales bacterium]|nr:hypothetical protein [Oligoflexales bacterium]